jgi:hypothetical protein
VPFISVREVGNRQAQLIVEAGRELKRANRLVAREIVKVGGQAMRKEAPRMWGRKLAIKTKTATTPFSVLVLFFPAPKNAGGWAIQESGARAHDIYPKRGRKGRGGRPAALSFSELYSAHAWHPGTSGNKAWTKAGARLEKALTPAIEDVYDEALT